MQQVQAYGQVKRLVQAGREFEEISESLGKWMGAVSDIDNINKNSNNPSTFDKLFNGSIEEVALKSYSAKLQIQKQREELKNWIIGHYGMARMGEPTERRRSYTLLTTRGYIRY